MNFIERREQLASEYRKIKDDIYSYSEMLKRYSTFERKNILKVLSEIVSAIEGVEFAYIETYSRIDSSAIFETGLYDYKNNKFLYDTDTLKTLRKLIFIKYDSQHISELVFYRLNYDSVDFKVPANFEGFPYLEEFLNRVIAYRFEHKMEKISPEELNRLKYEFLAEKLEEKRAFYANALDEAKKNLVPQDANGNK